MINNIFFKICLGVLISIAIIYSAYQYYQNSKPVITIYPDELPAKIKPSSAEEIALSGVHSSIYENLISKNTNLRIAKLLPEPEKPVIIDSRDQSDDPFKVDSSDKISHLISSIEPSISEVSDKQAEPKKDETGLNIIKLEKKNRNNYTDIKKSNNSIVYKVQLGSVKSEAEAIKEGERIKKQFSKILKNAVISTQKVKYDDGKFFYLILAGNYDNLSQAKAVCKKLAQNKQSCVLK
ncbi:MAG: SPOR domain-containing protein [Rickettsia endosymbiont of Argas persicus]